MRFDLTDLRLFVNVVEAGTLTAGAERTHMTLASASQRVLGHGRSAWHRPSGAPQERGAPYRGRAHAGAPCAPGARAGQVEQLRAEMGAFGKGLQGRIRLLANTSAMRHYLPPVLAGFLVAHPRVSIELEEHQSEKIVEALGAGLADLGIVSDSVATAGLDSRVLARDDLVLLLPRNDPLAGRRSIALAEVAERDFVGLAAGIALQETVAAHARRLGKRLDYRIRVRSFEAMCAMVEQGIGLAVAPRTVLSARRGRGSALRALPLSDAWARRHLLVCWRAGTRLPRHAMLLLNALAAPAESKGQAAT